MQSTTSRKIEAIYPLGELQRGLLLHHQLQPTADAGLIQISCRLVGNLDPDTFRQAWLDTCRRHAALRASIHWRKLSKPVWAVHHQPKDCIDYADWRDRPAERQRADWRQHLAADRAEPLPLDSAPVARLYLVRTAAEEHYFAWTSHHILLDGWSGDLVLKDLLAYYAARTDGQRPELAVPASYGEYLRWHEDRDVAAAETFWREHLGRLSKPTLFPSGNNLDGRGAQVQAELELSVATSEALMETARTAGLTVNTLIQGAWGTLLGRYFAIDTVAFGTTVGGRPAEVPGIEHTAGMFAGVVPRVVELGRPDTLTHIQATNGRAAAHQFVGPAQLNEWGGGPAHNCLLVVQNYPWTRLAGGGLTVADYRGDLTTTYPVTCVVVPRDRWKIYLLHRADALDGARATWLLDGMGRLLRGLASGERLADVGTELPPPASAPAVAQPAYRAPRGATELMLLRLWEEVLPAGERFGTDDDFFALGGTSLLALRLFADIERQTGRRIAPSELLQHRSIRQLAALIKGDTGGRPGWNNLVTLRSRGNKPPAFCLHAGEGHVLMYEPLMRHLDAERPVYALQPNGLDGTSELHGSIEEMATHYLGEIEALGTPDPLILISYCYSGAIAVEMGRQLIAAGRPAPIILASDIHPTPTEPSYRRRKRRRGSLLWYVAQLRRRRFGRAAAELVHRYLPLTLLPRSQRQTMRRYRLKYGLIDAFARYTWSHYGRPVLLIRSTKYCQVHKQAEALKSWKKLTDDRLTVRDVSSRHDTLFYEPAVAEVAHHLEQYLTIQ